MEPISRTDVEAKGEAAAAARRAAGPPVIRHPHWFTS